MITAKNFSLDGHMSMKLSGMIKGVTPRRDVWPEVEFQCGGPLFSETGSSNISAVN